MHEYSNKNETNSFLVNSSRYLDLRPRLMHIKLQTLVRRLRLGTPKVGHVHIPKTGGTYTNTLNITLPHVNFSHIVCRDVRSDEYCPVGLSPINKTKLRDYFLFSNVRNPVTFLISYYHHVIGFEGYINSNHYDYQNAKKGFDYLVHSILDREDTWPSRKFLFPMLFDQEGDLIVDWINRNECLDDDLASLATRFNCKFERREKARSAPKKSDNPLDYYSEDTLKNVLEFYSREMSLFGYTADGLIQPLFHLPETDKSALKYDYVSDSLHLNGSIITR